MALPPNGLLCLLTEARVRLDSPEAVYEGLRQANCLSAAGLAQRGAVIELIASFLAPQPGPASFAATPADRYTAHLAYRTPYLNRTGRRLYALQAAEYEIWRTRGRPDGVLGPARDLMLEPNPLYRLLVRVGRALRHG